MDNVIHLNNVTTSDIPVDQVLEAAKGNLTDGIVIGWDNEGDLYFASSSGNIAEVLLLVERGKLGLLERVD